MDKILGKKGKDNGLMFYPYIVQSITHFDVEFIGYDEKGIAKFRKKDK